MWGATQPKIMAKQQWICTDCQGAYFDRQGAEECEQSHPDVTKFKIHRLEYSDVAESENPALARVVPNYLELKNESGDTFLYHLERLTPAGQWAQGVADLN